MRPSRRRRDVAVDLGPRGLTIERSGPPLAVIRQQQGRRHVEYYGRFAAPLGGRPGRGSEPATVLVLAQVLHAVMPVQAAVELRIHHTYIATRHEQTLSGWHPKLGDLARVDADPALLAAGVGSQREAQHVDCLIAAPEQRAVSGLQPSQPMPARFTEAARPVIVQGVVPAHLPVRINLEAWLQDPTARAAVHSGESLGPGDFPALVIGVVVRAQVHVGCEADVPAAAYAVLVLPRDDRRCIQVDALAKRGNPDPRPHLLDRPEEPDGGR